MSQWNTVTIVGVGLIGGSIGLALRQRGLAARVVGVGRRAASLRQAKQRGAVTSTTTRLARGVSQADLIVVCTPVGSIVEHVVQAAEHCRSDALITDAGSTKEEIVNALQRRLKGRVAFVGSHPLAGSEKRGPQFATSDLFQDRLVVVTPTRRSPAWAVEQVESFWRALGARIVRKSPRSHDQALATTSHLPHLVAAALAACTPAAQLPLTASGWADTTRVAAGDAQLWQQILSDNRHHLLKSLDKFEKVLASYREALLQNDAKRMLQLLEAGKRHRDSVGS